jgi:type 1 glutamine amidotransferase
MLPFYMVLFLPGSIPVISSSPSRFPKWILYLFFLILFITTNFFLYIKYQQLQTTSITPTLTPTPTPIPTVTIIPKKWSDLKISIQNGSGKAGYAGSIADKFKQQGLTNITTGNADRSDYTQSILIFSNQSLKDQFVSKFIAIFPVSSSNQKIDKDQVSDVVLVLGTN